jgi:cell division septation protein DedD
VTFCRIFTEVLVLKEAMSNRNREGAATWRWVFGLSTVLVLIVAALWFWPVSSPSPVRAPAAVRGKITHPAIVSGQPPAALNIAPAPAPHQPAAVPSAAASENPDSGAPVQPLADAPAVVSAGKTPASAPNTADSGKGAAGGHSDTAEPGHETGISAEQPNEPPAAAKSAAPVEVQADNHAPAPEEAPSAPDRSAAEKPLQKEPPAVVPLQKASFTIQVGAFRNKVHADEMFDLLRNRGYDPFIFLAARSGKSDLYTVRFGRFVSRGAAAKVAAGFTQKEKMAAVVRHSGSL